MDRIKGYLIYHATKPGTIPDKHGENHQKAISQKKLMKRYLCCGVNSPCVVLRQCECLDVCQYGQQHIKATSEDQDGKAGSDH